MKPMRMTTKTILTATALIGSATLFYACLNPIGSGYGLNEAGDVPTSYFNDKVQPIFDTKCTSCHHPSGIGWSNTGGSSNDLDLTLGNSYNSLLGTSGTGQATFELPAVVPMLRVTPGDAANSYLYEKVESATPKGSPGFARMPLGGPYLSADEIAIIKKWIDDGAKP